MTHVLIEISGGVLSNVLKEGEGGDITVWLRDYDSLHEQGFSHEEAEQRLPVVYDGFGDEIPPASFTKHPNPRARLLKSLKWALAVLDRCDPPLDNVKYQRELAQARGIAKAEEVTQR